MKPADQADVLAVGLFAVIAGAGEVVVGLRGNYLGILDHGMPPSPTTVVVGCIAYRWKTFT